MFGESWSGYLRFLRLAFLLIAIVTIGRLALGVFGVPYEKGTVIFSLVITAYYFSFLYGAFARKLRGYRLLQAMLLGAIIGFVAEVIIMLLTVASYALDVDTYFNHITALNVQEAIPLGEALGIRLVGLANTIICAILGLLGWLGGALLPEAGAGKSA